MVVTQVPLPLPGQSNGDKKLRMLTGSRAAAAQIPRCSTTHLLAVLAPVCPRGWVLWSH